MHLYSDLLCIAVHPKCFTIGGSGGGGGDDVTAATGQQQVERRESHRVNQVDGDY